MNFYETFKKNLKESNLDSLSYDEKINYIFNKYRDEFDTVNEVRDIADYLNTIYEEHGESGVNSFFLPAATNSYKSDFKSLVRGLSEEKERKAQEKADKVAKGITGYSSKGKKQDVINSFKSSLEPDIYVKPPSGWGDNTIGFKKPESRVGLRAYLKNKDLPDDTFALSFNTLTANKYKDALDEIKNLKTGDYSLELGSNPTPYEFWTFKLADIPKISQAISNILNSETQISESEETNYKQEFIDYCKGKVKRLGRKVKYPIHDGDDYEITYKVVMLGPDGEEWIEDVDDEDAIVGYWDEKTKEVCLVKRPYGSEAEVIADLNFSAIDKKVYDSILEYWDDIDMDYFFDEVRGNMNESQTQEIEEVVNEFKEKNPNISKYLDEYLKEIEKDRPTQAYDKDKDQMNPEWENWYKTTANVLYNEEAWNKFTKWVADKYGENINESNMIPTPAIKKDGTPYNDGSKIDPRTGERYFGNSKAEEAYMKYVRDWLEDREFSLEDELRYWSGKDDNFDISDYDKMYQGLYDENGIGGELFVSYDEFLNNEYQINESDDNAGVYYTVYTTSEVAPGEYQTNIYDTYDSQDQAAETVSYLHSQGINATYTTDDKKPEGLEETDEQKPITNVCGLEDGKSYWVYVSKHGLGPGTIPNDVEATCVCDLPNTAKTIFCVDRKLTPEEMSKYELSLFDNDYFNRYPEVIKELFKM